MQIKVEVFTGILARAVGAVGNVGRQSLVPSLFSKSPEMHRRVLEIGVHGEVEDHKQDKPAFHFSEVNYGYYGYFYLFNKENTDNRRIVAASNKQEARGTHIADHSKASVD